MIVFRKLLLDEAAQIRTNSLISESALSGLEWASDDISSFPIMMLYPL